MTSSPALDVSADAATSAELGPSDPFNIAHHLPRQAAERPYARAVVIPRERGKDGRRAYAQATFLQLNQLCDRYAHALRAAGVQQGQRVLILVKPGAELVAVIYAVFKLGAIAVFIDPGMGLGKLVECVSRIEPAAFVGVSRAQMALALFGRRALATVKVRALVGGGLGWGALDLDQAAQRASDQPFEIAPTTASDTAAVLFTSGSTGPAKGVVYQHGMFQAQVDHLREVYGIEPGEVDLPGLPVFALFSVAFGATTVFPDMDPTKPAQHDPKLWVEAIEDHGVTYSFGSPAIWWPVARYCREQGIQLPSLRRVLMAGAPVPPALHEQLAELLGPDARTHTPYGATEGLPVSTIDGQTLIETFAATREGAGTCVGRPLPGVDVRVIAIDDQPLASFEQAELLGSGQRGEIVVAGRQVTQEYCELPEATAAAKIREGARIWHRMGDMGYLDDEGRLWFLGRKSHRVESAAGRLYPVACEAVFNEHPRVYRSALVGIGERGAQTPAIVVEPQPGHFPRGAAARETFRAELAQLAQAHEHTRGIERFLFHESFPVDLRHNAKIRRGDLAVWASAAR